MPKSDGELGSDRSHHNHPETDGPLAVVEELRREFNGTAAVAGVSFNINRGEIFGLLGPNGAGKTTTIRMMATTLKPTSGKVWIGGIVTSAHIIQGVAQA